MRLVLFAGAIAAGTAFAQAPRRPPSARQQERIDQQERLIACNRQAREAGLRGRQRHDFVRDCAKADNGAVGGGRQR